MFQCDQTVVYSNHGVCKIIAVETRSVSKKSVEYYVLEPIDQPGTRYYVPKHNQAAAAKLQALLTREELDELLASDAACRNIWISDENQRKASYRALLNSGDRAGIICMIRTLRRHKNDQIAAGRKFHLSDEAFLKDGEKLLGAEFSMVLNIPVSEVGNYIENKIAE